MPHRPDTQRSAQKVATRARVLDAAKACFNVMGYDAATIRAIAGEAGMSTGAVFAHFTDKAALYREIFGHPPVPPELGAALLAAAKEALGTPGMIHGRDRLAGLVERAEG